MDMEDTNLGMIKSFLDCKIQEAVKEVASAQEELEEWRKHKDRCIEKLKQWDNYDGSCIVVNGSWQRVFDNKWIVGFHMQNNYLTAKNIKVLLKCTGLQCLEYTVKIYARLSAEDEWILDEELKHASAIVIVLNVPEFTACKSYVLQSTLLLEQNDKKLQIPLPDESLEVSDVMTLAKSIRSTSLINGVPEDYLSVLSASITTQVSVSLPEHMRSFFSMLEIDCCFTKSNMPARTPVYVYDGPSVALNACFIRTNQTKLDEVRLVRLVTRNENQLKLLLHHLYTNIPGITVCDEQCETLREEKYYLTRPTQMPTAAPDQSSVKEFTSALQEQINFAVQSISRHARPRTQDDEIIDFKKEEYELFRMELAEKERRVDECYKKLFPI